MFRSVYMCCQRTVRHLLPAPKADTEGMVVHCMRTVLVQAFQLWPTSNEMTRIPVKLNEARLKSPP